MTRWRPLVWGLLGSFFTLVVLYGIWSVPVTWRKSIGIEVMEFRVPLGIKLTAFVYRDWMYRHIVAEATAGVTGDQQRVDALFDWTVEHVRTDVPQNWSVEDDHPLHVIIRGYGVDWQVADVFAILCTYAGYPAKMAGAQPLGPEGRLILTLVDHDGDWRVYDPYYRNRFIQGNGLPITFEQLQADASLARLAAHQPVVGGLPYEAFFYQIEPVEFSPLSRSLRQMWWPRVWYELTQVGRRMLGQAS